MLVSRRLGTGWLAAPLFLLTSGFILTKSGRDALYFQGSGVSDLPWAYVGIALVSMPAAVMTLRVIERLGARRVRVGGTLLVAAYLGAMASVASPGGGALMTAFFTSVPVLFGILFSVTWLMAAEVGIAGQARDSATIYARAGAMAIAGGIAGGALARALAGLGGPHLLLWLGASALALGAGVMHAVHRRYPLSDIPTRRLSRMTPIATVRRAIRGAYSRRLMLAGASGAFVGVMIEMQLFLAAAASPGDAQSRMAFFGSLYGALNVGALVLQLTLVPALQRRTGIGGALLILPLTMLSGAVLLGSALSLTTRSLLRAAEGGLKASVHRVSWEQAFAPLDDVLRPQTKVVVDGLGSRLAEGAAAATLLCWLYWVVGDGALADGSPWILNAVLAVGAAVWLRAVWSLRDHLARALAERPLWSHAPDY